MNPGQQRVLIAWQRLIFPNGDSLPLAGQPGVDLAGFAGLSDQVDQHTWELLGSSIMYSLFSAASQLSQSVTGGEHSPANVLFSATGQQISQTGSRLTGRNLSIQPTLVIRAGMPFHVLLGQDLSFPHPYAFDEAA